MKIFVSSRNFELIRKKPRQGSSLEIRSMILGQPNTWDLEILGPANVKKKNCLEQSTFRGSIGDEFEN